MIEDVWVRMKDDSVFIYWRLQKMIKLISMMNMNDDVPKLPMTYRDSPVNCTTVVAVVTVVEYLPS